MKLIKFNYSPTENIFETMTGYVRKLNNELKYYGVKVYGSYSPCDLTITIKAMYNDINIFSMTFYNDKIITSEKLLIKILEKYYTSIPIKESV